MIDRYFTQHKTRNRVQNGPIGPFFPAFITALEDRGHAVSPHMIRHGTAMALLQAGVDIAVIALYL